MGKTPSFTDPFGRRSASEADGLGQKPDRFKPRPKPEKPKLAARSAPAGDAFAPRPTPAKPQGLRPHGRPKEAAQPAQPTRIKADAFSPTARAAKASPFTRPVTKAELLAKAGKAKPTAKPTMTRPVAKASPAKSALVPLAPAGNKAAMALFKRKPAAGKIAPAIAVAAAFGTPQPKAKAALPKPAKAMRRKPPAKQSRDAVMVDAPATTDPVLDGPAETEAPVAPLFAPEPARKPLHVVSSQPGPVERAPSPPPKLRPVVRTTSLVLVSGAGAMTASDTDVLEKPAVEPEKPAAPPPPAEPPSTAPPSLEARKIGGGGGDGPKDGSGDGTGSGPGGGSGPAAPVRVRAERRFNQDDAFGVIFGLAVLAFLLLWVMRGRGDAGPLEPDALVAPQSLPSAVAAAPPPADPFGNAPVNLRPTGEVPEGLPDVTESAPADTPLAEPATPPVAAAVPPPAVAAVPEVPLAERRMNAWFCTASSRLTKASRENLNAELEKFASVFEGQELVVRGYADTRGATDYNAALSGERARVVADFLRTKGLTIAESNGVGELEGLDDNQNCPNQRRVDVWVKGGPAGEPSRACTPTAEQETLVCAR